LQDFASTDVDALIVKTLWVSHYSYLYNKCYDHNIFTTNHKWLITISFNLNLSLKLFVFPLITTHNL